MGQLTGAMALLALLVILTMTFVELHREESASREALLEQAASVSQTLVSTSAGALHDLDTTELTATLRTLRQSAVVVDGHFYDAQGRLVADADGSKDRFHLDPDPDGRRAVAAGGTMFDWRGEQLHVAAPIDVGRERVGAVDLTISADGLAGELAAIRVRGIVTILVALPAGFLLAWLCAGVVSGPLRALAESDPLTRLPNRTSFSRSLNEALRDPRRLGIAVLFVDLDDFKLINDSLGHERGDELLVEVAQRMQDELAPTDIVARFGGDEFTVLLEHGGGIEDAVATADRLASALHRPVTLDGYEVVVTASVGVAMTTSELDTAAAVLRAADIAMYEAKASGKARWALFRVGSDETARDRLDQQAQLRHAIDRDEIVVYFQPRVRLGSGPIVGAEALVRWLHPERGLVSPAEFIPLAEQTGLIVPLGCKVLRDACHYATEWAGGENGEPGVVSVNISARHLSSGTLVDDVQEALVVSGLPPQRLELEITESWLMESGRDAFRVLNHLKALGVRLAIDDFGTGYSSLAYLSEFPFDVLKIDRSFIHRIHDGPRHVALVEAMTHIGTALDLEVTAEGIETAEQATVAKALGCQFGQGYFYAPPLPAEGVAALFAGLGGPLVALGPEQPGDARRPSNSPSTGTMLAA